VNSTVKPAHPTWKTAALQAVFNTLPLTGVVEEDRLLPIGTELTAVGILDTSNSAAPAIKATRHIPYFLTRMNREELVEELGIRKELFFWTGLGAGALAAACIWDSAVRNWRSWAQSAANIWRRLRGEPVEAPLGGVGSETVVAQLDDDEADTGPVADGQLCVVCLQRSRKVVFLHCGHRVCCCTCAMSIRREDSPKCPICRGQVTAMYRVFDS